jgi:predicted nucleic acid-binding protein
MAFVVIYDANVLYPSLLRDVLIRVAQRGLVRARWTERILDEVFMNLVSNRPDLDRAKLVRTRELMNASVRDVLVEGYEPLIPTVTIPDENDRHVVAAAIRAQAQMVVTTNLRDFPSEELSKWNIEAKHPDDFLVDQFHLDAIALHVILQQIADNANRPQLSLAEVLDGLERCGITQATALLRR